MKTKSKFKHDLATGLEADNSAVGRGSGNGYLKEIKAALDAYMEKRGMIHRRERAAYSNPYRTDAEEYRGDYSEADL